MNGLSLSKEYYETFGRPMLEEQFPDLLPKIAVGLAGAGSECFGYDDAVSEDHDFEPGFCIFARVDDGTASCLTRKEAFGLERAYAKLPKEFNGYTRSAMSPVGGNRRGLIEIGDFLEKTTGTHDGRLTAESWLRTPEMSLLEAVNGAIWRDDGDVITSVREELREFPEDIRLKKLAGTLLLMAQSGQYNYRRCLDHGEPAASQLACFEFTQNAIHAAHLLECRYTPYYKWAFRSLRSFDAELASDLEGLITTPNDPETAESKYFVMEDIASRFIDRLMEENLTEATCGDLEKHAYSVNDRIRDSGIRNMHILAAF